MVIFNNKRLDSKQAIALLEKLFENELPLFKSRDVIDNGLYYFIVTYEFKDIKLKFYAEKGVLLDSIEIAGVKTGLKYLEKKKMDAPLFSGFIDVTSRNINEKFFNNKKFVDDYLEGKIKNLPTNETWKETNKDYLRKRFKSKEL